MNNDTYWGESLLHIINRIIICVKITSRCVNGSKIARFFTVFRKITSIRENVFSFVSKVMRSTLCRGTRGRNHLSNLPSVVNGSEVLNDICKSRVFYGDNYERFSRQYSKIFSMRKTADVLKKIGFLNSLTKIWEHHITCKSKVTRAAIVQQ